MDRDDATAFLEKSIELHWVDVCQLAKLMSCCWVVLHRAASVNGSCLEVTGLQVVVFSLEEFRIIVAMKGLNSYVKNVVGDRIIALRLVRDGLGQMKRDAQPRGGCRTTRAGRIFRTDC